MYLIVWLWNPWREYSLTRHNLGFLFVDYLKEEYNFSHFKLDTKLKGEISSWLINGEKIILLKPQTFMNLSGQSIQLVSNFYKIPKENIIIIYDDISMDFGKIRVRTEGSAGWHNGIKSVIEHFGQEFTRIKYWVWLNPNFEVSDWVLSKFTKQEVEELEQKWFEKIENELHILLKKK
jgi:peptidyl-tRNA hydrolase, PTH1 family